MRFDVTQVGDREVKMVRLSPVEELLLGRTLRNEKQGVTMSFIQEVEDKIKDVVNHTRTAVAKALEAAQAKAEQEKAVIAADVRKATADAVAVLKADAPEIEAALKTGAKAIVDAVEAALAAKGL